MYTVDAIVGMVLGMDLFLGNKLFTLLCMCFLRQQICTLCNLYLYQLGVGAVPVFLSVVFALLMQETPKFLLLTKNDKEGALKSLKFYQGTAKILF
jgi:hypothetical protein